MILTSRLVCNFTRNMFPILFTDYRNKIIYKILLVIIALQYNFLYFILLIISFYNSINLVFLTILIYFSLLVPGVVQHIFAT